VVISINAESKVVARPGLFVVGFEATRDVSANVFVIIAEASEQQAASETES